MRAIVSIIVPVYNGADSIKKCLDNLTSQTFKEIEIICVNDGSIDNSLEIINEYIKKDKRIMVVSQKNGGLSAARNTGLKNVKTPYVMFCDCDDIFAEEMCEIMVETIEQKAVDLVACGTEVEYQAHSEIEESDRNYYRIKFAGKNFINEEIIKKTDVSVCDKIFRADLIQKYKIEFPEKLNNEDYYFYNAYMSVAKTIFFVNRKLYKYIRHDDSIMSNNFDKNTYSPDHLLIAKKLFEFYRDSGFLEKHIDLFWEQFAESFWFSYEHSAKKYHQKLYKIAKDFIEKYYRRYQPLNPKARKKIYVIEHSNVFSKIVRWVKAKLSRMYKAVNIAYRQQDFINKSIEKLEQETYDISAKINSIEEKNNVQ